MTASHQSRTEDSAPTLADSAPLARVVRWEDATAWPLFAGSIIMFGISTWVLIGGLPPWLLAASGSIILLLWGLFIADYLVRLALARHARTLFVRTRVFDLTTLVLPFLRPFLLVVYIWRLPLFRYGSAARQRARYLITMVLFSIIFTYIASWGVWLVERNASGANILNFEDALFWGFTTISTVGYGNLVPVTTLGRFFAVCLMMGGIAIIGVTSATLISALNERVSKLAGNPASTAAAGAPTSAVPQDDGRNSTPQASANQP